VPACDANGFRTGACRSAYLVAVRLHPLFTLGARFDVGERALRGGNLVLPSQPMYSGRCITHAITRTGPRLLLARERLTNH
jgi:hypothetical protein